MIIKTFRHLFTQLHTVMNHTYAATNRPRYTMCTADATLHKWCICFIALIVLALCVPAYAQQTEHMNADQETACMPEQHSASEEYYMAYVMLREEATIDEQDVLLGDVACIHAEEQLAEQLQRVRVGSAPLIGKTHHISGATLRLRLRQAGFDDKNIHIGGSPDVEVERMAQHIDSDALQQVIQESVLQELPTGAQVNIEIESWNNIALPTGDVSLQAARLPRNVIGSSTIRVQVHVDGVLWRTVPVRVNTQVTFPVWVATRQIHAGEAIDFDNVELQSVELTRSLQPAVLHDSVPMRANRVIREGVIIEERFIEMIPDVIRGQRVAVRIEHDVLDVQASGTLLEDAMVGSIVTVKNERTDRIISGELISRDTVVVRMP